MKKKLSIWEPIAQGVPSEDFIKILSKHFTHCLENNIDIVLDFFPEGPNLYENNIWGLIQNVCNSFDVDTSNIQIEICDFNAAYPCKVIKRQPYWFNALYKFPDLFDHTINPKIEKLFGHFVGRPSWDRLVLHSTIKQTNNSLFTFWQGKDKPASYQKTLQNIQKLYPKDYEKYKKILDATPHSNIKMKPVYKDFTTFPRNVYPLKPYYQKIFVDIVSETFIYDRTCFITEKTARPIVFRTPFIIMGGLGFLKILKELGFKTFDKWWPEEYDNYSGQERVKQIQQVIKLIQAKDNIEQIKNEMLPVVEHNYKHLMSRSWNQFAKKLGLNHV